jgi:hypothetical protein
MDAHISQLQEQVDALFNNLNALRSQVDSGSTPAMDSPYPPHHLAGSAISVSQESAHSHSPFSGRALPPVKKSRFRGPTSSAFNLGLAKSSLQNMGIAAPEDGMDEGMATQNETPADSPPPLPSISQLQKTFHPSKDPIWTISKEETKRLLRLWQDEMGVMYPLLEAAQMEKHIGMLYTFIDAAARTGLMQAGLPGADAIQDDDTNLLKMILAIAFTLDGNGHSEPGLRMFENVRPVVEGISTAPADIRGVQMLGLVVSILLAENLNLRKLF